MEELLAERGVTVDHVTVYRWVQRFTPEFIEAARLRRHAPGDRWFADETYVKVAGRRPHRSRQLHLPRPDHPVADLSQERIQRRPILGGLINEYERAA